MRFSSIFTLAACAVVAVPTTGLAADLIIDVPTPSAAMFAPQSTFDWNGFYAGVNGGYVWDDLHNPAGAFIPANVPSDGRNWSAINGVAGGVQAGYNAQFDMFVLGVEGDIQLSGASQTSNSNPDVAFSLDYYGTVRARAGVALDRIMPYVTGGLAVAQGTHTVPGSSSSVVHTGFTVGGGVEVAVTDAVSVKTEYLYTDVNVGSYFGGAVPVDHRFHTVRAGVNFHF